MSFAAQLAVLTVVSLAVLTTFLDYQTHRGLLWGWQTTFGAMLLWLHDNAQLHIHIPHVWSKTLNFGGVFGRVNNRVVSWLQERLEHAEHEYALSVHALEATWHATVISVEWLAHETAATFDWINHVRIRQILKLLLSPVLFPLLLAKLLKAVIPHIRHGAVQTVKVIEHAAPAQIVKVFKYAIPATAPGVIGLPKIRSEIRGLTKRNLRLSKRLHRVEKLFGVAVMAAAMANVLGLPNWRCLTRGNIGRAARHFCGLDKWLVDLFLLGAVETFIATDLCEFSHLLGVAAKAQRPGLMLLVTAEDALVDCHGTTKPIPFNLPAASLPPLQGVSPLAA